MFSFADFEVLTSLLWHVDLLGVWNLEGAG